MEPRIMKGPDTKFFLEGMSLGQFFFGMSRAYGRKIAQIDSVTDEKETFNEVRQRSIRAAIEMSNRGITSEDVVVFCTVNCLDNIIPFIGATFLGAKVASLDPTLSLSHVKHLLNIVKPAMIFVENKSLTLIENGIEDLQDKPQIVSFGESFRYTKLQDFIEPVDNEDDFVPVKVSPKDPAIIFFSSGTTGLPKAICLSSENILYCVVNYDFKLDAVLNFTTLYWISGVTTVIASFFGGGYRVIVPRFDPEDAMRIIDKYQVNYTAMAPILTYKLTSLEGAENYNTTSLQTLLVGGTPISTTQLQKTRELFKSTYVLVAYGMTEIGFLTCFKPREHRELIATKLESCGKLAPGLVAKIVDIDTRELLPPYQKGEICCKSPGLMLGYYNGDASAVFDEDGFLKTGDVGYYDEDECFYVVDRIKEMFKYQSWHIVPSVIEIVLMEHPAVAEACVYGIPHEEDGEVPAASVVLKDGMTATPDEIAEFVAEKVLDREKLRAGVRIVESLQKTPTGKIVRTEARDRAMKS